jgi:hypothetical protein
VTFGCCDGSIPPLHIKSHVSAEAEAEALADSERWIGHPFHEEPAADGNLYPHDSKLRPASDDEPVIIEEYADIPPHCILTSGQPPIFTYEPPTNFSSDKSGPSDAKATPPST